MIFASNVFLFLYLPLFLAVYFLSRPQWRSTVIVAASYIFYAWWRPDFLLLFVAITYWNYWFGLRIEGARLGMAEQLGAVPSVRAITQLQVQLRCRQGQAEHQDEQGKASAHR